MESKVSTIIGIPIPNEVNSLPAKDICQAAKLICENVFMSETIEKAVSIAVSHKKNSSTFRIIFCGSLYLAGQILKNHK